MAGDSGRDTLFGDAGTDVGDGGGGNMDVLLVVEVAEGTAALGILKPWNWGEGPVELGGTMWIIALLSTVKWALLMVIAIYLTTFAYLRSHRRAGSRPLPQRR